MCFCGYGVSVTISQDLYVAAEKVAQSLLQLAAAQLSLQGGADGLQRPLDHQHGGLHHCQT